MKRSSPACLRNREPILSVLREVLPAEGDVLEIACGSGEHALFFSRALPKLSWQPTDISEPALASAAAWRDDEGTPNLLSPLRLDVEQHPWPVQAVDVIYVANMIHISPWSVSEGLFAGAGTALRPGGLLVTYGPYTFDGVHHAPSNAAFDASLRSRDERWGVRDLADLDRLAHEAGLQRREVRAMPANNHILVYVVA